MSRLAIAVLAQVRDSSSTAIAYAARGGEDWHHDELVVDAVANRVRQVAELTKYAFPVEERADYPQIPWNDMAKLRDFYTHHYARLDPNRLRHTVETSLPALLAELDRVRIPEFTEDEGPDAV